MLFVDAHDVVGIDERGLDIDLGELGLAIGAQILVAEAARDLVVAVHAGNHQQLLEQLRRLRQREEVPRLGPARHQIVARAFRCGAGQDRGFDVEEAEIVERRTHRAGDLRAQLHVALHARLAQFDVAIAQARGIAHRLGFVELQRRRLGGVENFQRRGVDLDLARGEVLVHRALGARAHPAGHLDHVFAAQALGRGKGFGLVGIEHDLDQPAAIAQIHEDHPAVVAAPVHPAADGDFAVDCSGGDFAAVVGSHHGARLKPRKRARVYQEAGPRR